MLTDRSDSIETAKGSFVDKLSPHDASVDGLLAKLTVSWLSFLAGISISDLFTLASLIYVLLNIYVLVRDKIVRRQVAAAEKRAEQSTVSGD